MRPFTTLGRLLRVGPRLHQDEAPRPRRHRPRRRVIGSVVAAAALVSGTVLALTLPTSAQAATATTYPGGHWQPDAATYGMTVVSRVPVTMDDGVVLPANVGYPTDPKTGQRASGTFPVLLVQNPYIFFTQPDPYFVDRGYIMAVVDVRGTGDSTAPGNAPLVNPMFGPRQAKDGAELVDWAAHKLDGSNGTVGLYGCSFLGIDQLFTAAAVGPNSPLKAIVPACASNTYNIYFAGGIPGPTADLMGSPSFLFGTKHEPENDAGGRQMEAEIKAGGPRAYNNAYWQERTTSPQMAATIVHNGIPTLLWTGWQAADSTGALEFYAALQNTSAGRPATAPMAPGQPTTGRYQIVVGNWFHGQGLDPGIDLEWYDTWLKNQDTGMTRTTTPMHLYQTGTGTNRWVNAATYPLTATYSPFFLQPGSSLKAVQPAPGAAAADPLTWGPPQQSGTTLTYTTPTFGLGATLAGPVSATVYAASSNTNLELDATLQDVAPGGKATTITGGALLGSLAALDPTATWQDSRGVTTLPVHPYAADEYLTPGQVRRFDIKLTPTLWSLQPGHSLRLVLSTQGSASQCLNFLGAAAPCTPTAPQQQSLTGGVYRIQHSTAFPSAVNLPLLPYQSLPTARSGKTPTSLGETEPLGW